MSNLIVRNPRNKYFAPKSKTSSNTMINVKNMITLLVSKRLYVLLYRVFLTNIDKGDKLCRFTFLAWKSNQIRNRLLSFFRVYLVRVRLSVAEPIYHIFPKIVCQ